ncbi:NAD(P)-dependent alcohol dehydrogenase [Hydrogenophaga sp.]|uniref:NAD(P)-dependent alcohol dehydrogenase n=1 Tax=Hydrogenophaga sp. TaxID=1904254 RepID=UPI00263081E5|nr:NAD(P)-dependent alcohol dehydrogenase [Hydrogenophaga sp.]MCW5652188.1 NAD(P)-dependent alcohol dehydrogenase [Hydrogenophaga sp.]
MTSPLQIQAALRRDTGGPLAIETVTLEPPRVGEVLVRVVATGICHTDVAVRDGEMPMPAPGILGHEGAGVVVAAGGDSAFKAGDPVIMSFAHCGQCRACLLGRPSDCTRFFALNFNGHRPDGSCCHSQAGQRIFGHFFGQSSFATHALVDERYLVPVPADLPLESLGPLGCGIQTGAGAVLQWMKPVWGSSLAVFGLGAVGMSALMAAKLQGCDPLIAVDVQPARLALALELGATHVLDARSGDVTEQIRALTGGLGADHVVEAIGNPKHVNGCLAAVRSRGSVALLGAPRAGETVALDSITLMRGLTIKSVVEGDAVPRVFIPELLRLHRAGRFPFEKLLRFYDFSQINEAIDAMNRGEVIKPVLRMPGGAA